MATALLFRFIHRRHISSASLLAFKSISGAKTSGTTGSTYLSRKSGVIARSFSRRPNGCQVVGIDLGTTNSRLAVIDGQIAKVMRNVERSLSTPSVVAFNDKGEYLTVGSEAKYQAVTTPKNIVSGAKRLIGRRFDDPQTQKQMGLVSYNIVKALSGDAWIEVNGRKYSPKQIVAFVLAKMTRPVDNNGAVISVPGCFNKAQRKAIMDAARIANLHVHSIIDDSKAAAISYVLHSKDGLIAVVDLGGGTCDVSILEIVDSHNSFECLTVAKNGDASLGGEDFDGAIVDFLISEFKRATDGIDLRDDIVALQRLREAAEWAKIELSTRTQIEINLPFIITDSYGAKHLNMTLTRSEFEAQVKPLIQRIKSLCEKCIKDAVTRLIDLDEVIIVGGMSRVPIVQQVVTEIFGKTPIKVVNPDEVVAMGASYYWGLNNYIHEDSESEEEYEEEEPYQCNWETCE